MANIRLQSILKNKIDAIIEQTGSQGSTGATQKLLHRGFTQLMLRDVFDIDEYEIDEAITDGWGDKGIDAIFEQVNQDDETILYVMQTKYFENPDKSLDETTINKITLAVSNYVLGNCPLDGSNSNLERRIENYKQRLSNGKIDRLSLVFVTNGQKVNKELISVLDMFKEQQAGQVIYEIYTESELAHVFSPVSAIPVKRIELKIVKDSGSGEKTFINLPDIDFVQGRVAKVDVCVLAEIVRQNPNIFNSNVRAYQSIRNKVNGQIAKTLRDEELSKQFIYLNNGITLLCNDFDIKLGGETIVIYNPSIINGCQTASTILEVYEEGSITENTAFVLLRIIKSKDEQVKKKIIISSNTQTAIRNRDFISEDPIQQELESHFETLGYFYERKKGLYRNEPQAKVIDLEKAAQYYLALYLRKPAEAKNKKNEIYKGYYEQIFNRDLTAQQLLVGYILFDKINERVKFLRKAASESKKSVLGNSTLHLLPLFREWAVEAEGKFLSDIEDDLHLLDKLFNEKIDTVIKRLERAINKLSHEEGFNPQYFFKNADSLEKILEIEDVGNEQVTLELDSAKEKRQKDLRYYKPYEYSLGDEKYKKVKHWNDLFVDLVELYAKNNELDEGSLNFLDLGERPLLQSNPNENERKLRKELKNGLWLLTNFSSRYLSRSCFDLASKRGLDLSIRLRPTRFRIERKYKRRSRRASKRSK